MIGLVEARPFCCGDDACVDVCAVNRGCDASPFQRLNLERRVAEMLRRAVDATNEGHDLLGVLNVDVLVAGVDHPSGDD